MQSRNKPLADIANLVTNAVGAAKGVGDEIKAMSRSQAEKFIADMDLVTRQEFDVLKMRLDAALEEIEALKVAKTDNRHIRIIDPATGEEVKRADWIREVYQDEDDKEFYGNRGAIARKLSDIQGKEVPYQIVFAATQDLKEPAAKRKAASSAAKEVATAHIVATEAEAEE